jgi:hypothetical protein
MAKPYPEQYAEKHSIVKELFIATADDNYVNARWCFHENLNVDFFWLAVHCLEKYLKAVLLLNGESSLKYQHEIVELFQQVKKSARCLLPATLVRPADIPAEMWREEQIEDFIERLYRDGQAHNRYQLFGYSRRPGDLWKLDQVVFAVRRLCQPLDTAVFPQENTLTYREILLRNPKRWSLDNKLEETFDGKRGDVLKHAFLNRNFPFAPDGYMHSPIMTYTFASQESVLGRRLFDPLETGPERFAASDGLWLWVKENIFVPKTLAADIEREREQLKKKAIRKKS